MPMIYVKAKNGRVAYDGPKGKKIPNDAFIPVEETPWIRRLIDFHGDVEIESKKPAPTEAVAATKAEKTAS